MNHDPGKHHPDNEHHQPSTTRETLPHRAREVKVIVEIHAQSHPGRVLAATAAAVLAAVALAGCSGSSGGNASPSTTSGSSASGTSAASGKKSSPTASGTPTTRKGTVTTGPKNDLDRRKQVSMTTCAAAPGGWKAGGTIKNAGGASHDYSIIVYFTNDSATDLGQSKATVAVDGGATKSWSVTGTFKAPKKVLCVLGPVS